MALPDGNACRGVLGVTRQVADPLANAATADIIFGRYRMGVFYDVEAKTILPLDPGLLIASEGHSRPLHQIDPGKLLQQVASECLFAEIAGAVMELLASENGARLLVLEGADGNIGDELEISALTHNALFIEVPTQPVRCLNSGDGAG